MYFYYPRVNSYQNDGNNEIIVDIENSIRHSLLDNNNDIQQTNRDNRICYLYILFIIIVIYLTLVYIYI